MGYRFYPKTKVVDMKNLDTFFKGVFDVKENSDVGLLNFTQNHIENLVENNEDRKYDSLIEDTSYLYQRFLFAYEQKQKVNVTKKAQTTEVNMLLEQCKEHIRKLSAFIQAFHSKESEIYKSFFPNGLSEYSGITKSNITYLMSRIHFAAETYQGLIDTKIITGLFETELLYQENRKEQVKRKKTFKSYVENKKELRKALSIQLQINLFELAKEYIGEPEKESLFFNTELLQSKSFNLEKSQEFKNVG